RRPAERRYGAGTRRSPNPLDLVRGRGDPGGRLADSRQESSDISRVRLITRRSSRLCAAREWKGLALLPHLSARSPHLGLDGSVRVAPGVTMGLATASFVLLGAQAVLLLDRELDDLRSAAAAEIGLLSRSWQVASENAMRDREEADITETLVRLESI